MKSRLTPISLQFYVLLMYFGIQQRAELRRPPDPSACGVSIDIARDAWLYCLSKGQYNPMQTVKTAISIQENLFEQAEALAQQMNISRSRLFVLALEDYIRRQQDRELLAQDQRSLRR